jgi:hypothetical protein
MFVRDPNGDIDNSTEGAVAEWLSALGQIHAERVHVYTIDRPPALASLIPVPRRRLREIAEHVRAIGIPAEIFVSARGTSMQGILPRLRGSAPRAASNP